MILFRIVLLTGEWVSASVFVASVAMTWTSDQTYFLPAAISLSVGLLARVVARDLSFERGVHRVITTPPRGGVR